MVAVEKMNELRHQKCFSYVIKIRRSVLLNEAHKNNKTQQ